MCSFNLKPAKNAALKSVVASCDTPPPTESTSSPSATMGAATNPRSVVRLPSTLLRDSVPPAGMIVPFRISEALRMFVTRGWPES